MRWRSSSRPARSGSRPRPGSPATPTIAAARAWRRRKATAARSSVPIPIPSIPDARRTLYLYRSRERARPRGHDPRYRRPRGAAGDRRRGWRRLGRPRCQRGAGRLRRLPRCGSAPPASIRPTCAEWRCAGERSGREPRRSRTPKPAPRRSRLFSSRSSRRRRWSVVLCILPRELAVSLLTSLLGATIIFGAQIFLPSRERDPLLLLTAVALLLRLMALILLHRQTVTPMNPDGFMFPDSFGYDRVGEALAQHWRHGTPPRLEYQTAGYTIGFHYVVACIYYLFGHVPFMIKTLNVLLSTSLVPLTFLLGTIALRAPGGASRRRLRRPLAAAHLLVDADPEGHADRHAPPHRVALLGELRPPAALPGARRRGARRRPDRLPARVHVPLLDDGVGRGAHRAGVGATATRSSRYRSPSWWRAPGSMPASSTRRSGFGAWTSSSPA